MLASSSIYTPVRYVKELVGIHGNWVIVGKLMMSVEVTGTSKAVLGSKVLLE